MEQHYDDRMEEGYGNAHPKFYVLYTFFFLTKLCQTDDIAVFLSTDYVPVS